MTPHDEMGTWAGAYILGALDPDERSRFETHLTTCERCRTAVTELGPLPGLLSRLDGWSEADPRTDIADAAIAQIDEEMSDLRRSRRRWRAGAIAAALIALVVGAVALVGPRGSGDSARPVALGVESALDWDATVEVTSMPWGTEIRLDCDWLPAGDDYVLLAQTDDGRSEIAGSWSIDAARPVIVTGASGIRTDELARVVVTDGTGREIITAS